MVALTFTERENNCHRQSLSYQTVKISDTTKTNFSNWTYLEVIEKYDKTTAV